MAHEQAAAHRLELPTIIFGTIEIHHLQRELEALEEFLSQAAIRQPGKQVQLPRASRILEALAENNGLNLLTTPDRQRLRQFLQELADTAPVINMSFASDPSAAFTAKIVTWLRANIHPYTLLQLGLQPSIAAGCVVRTANKTFDFSLRNRFYDKRQLLIDSISDGAGTAETPSSAKQEVVA